MFWNKEYGGIGSNSIQGNPIQLENGEFIFISITVDSVPPNNPLGWLMKISSNGDSIWSRTFAKWDGQNYFTDIKPTADDGFIISGYAGNNLGIGGGQDMWLIKVDSLGCDTAGCWITDVKEDLAVGSGNRQLMIYPNPFSEYAYIKVNDMFAADSEIRIVDVTGRIIKTYRIFYPKQMEIINAREFGAGIFFVQIVKNGIVKTTEKIISLQ